MRRVALTLTVADGPALAVPAASAHERFTDFVRPYRSVGGIPIEAAPSQIRVRFGATTSGMRHRLSGFTHVVCGEGLGCTITRGGGGDTGAPGAYSTVFSTANGKVDGLGVGDTFNDG